MKRKKVVLIFLVLSLFLFCSCGGNDTINDKNTGKVYDYAYKNEYKNGKYYVYSKYFNNDGRCPVLTVRVKNKIISKVEFYYVDEKYSKVKNKDDEEFLIDNLDTLVLQNQGKIDYESKQEDLSFIISDYKILLKNVLDMMSKKTNENINENSHAINIDYEYFEESKKDDLGYVSELKVIYEDEKITKTTFTQINSLGENKGKDNYYTNDFKQNNETEYQDYINSLMALSDNSEKLILSKDSLEEDMIYNKLARKINQKRKKVKQDIMK